MTHDFVVVRRDLEVMTKRIGEVDRPSPDVIHHPGRSGPLPYPELRQARDEDQPLLSTEPKCHAVKPSRRPTTLGLTAKQRELGSAPIRRQHERALRVGRPLLGTVNGPASEDTRIPIGSLGPVGHEQLNVIQCELEDLTVAHGEYPVSRCRPDDLRFSWAATR
jgi:hypothetical protein